ncbi:MAG: protein kinase [Planctomycetota bacterium]
MPLSGEVRSALPQPGASLGDYVVERELGRGAMGAVFLGRHRALGSRHALKISLLSDPVRRERFAREARALARIEGHPGVVRIHHFEAQPSGVAFFALELIEGGDLEEALAAGPFPVERALAVGEGIARGLAHVHAAGVVHRDLKPANVLLRGGKTPVLADFGVARDEQEERLTHSQAVLGTLDYMAPEQLRGAGGVGPPADVFALGGILYRMLCGRPAFEGESAAAVMAQVLAADPPPPRRLRPELSPALEAVVLAALAEDPARRPRAAELAEELAALRRGEEPARRSSGWLGRTWQRARRSGRARLAGAALLACALVVAALASWLGPQARARRELAQLLDATLPRLERADPLLRGEPRGEVERVLEQSARLLDEQRPGGPGLADALAAAQAGTGPLAWLSPGQRAGLATLRLRLSLAQGRGWCDAAPPLQAPDPDASPERHLLSALALLRWAQPVADGPARAPSQREVVARLLAAAGAGPAADLRRALTEVERSLQGAARAAQTALDDALAGRAAKEPLAPEASAPALGDPALGDPLASYRARRQAEQVRADAPGLIAALEAWARSVPPERWADTRPCADLARALSRVLLPWWRRASVSAAALRPGLGAVLRRVLAGLEAHPPREDIPGVYELVAALQEPLDEADPADDRLVSWEDPEVRQRLHGLLLFGLNGAVLRRAPPPVPALSAFILLRSNPSGARFVAVAGRMIAERAFETFLAEPRRRRAEAYLVWALCLNTCTMNATAEQETELLGQAAVAFDLALGAQLPPESRARLGLGPARPRLRPLDAWGATFARSRLLRALGHGRRDWRPLADEAWALLPAAQELFVGDPALDFLVWAARAQRGVSAACGDPTQGRTLAARCEHLSRLALAEAEACRERFARPQVPAPDQVHQSAISLGYWRALSELERALYLLDRQPESLGPYAAVCGRLGEDAPLVLQVHYAAACARAGELERAARLADAVVAEVDRSPGARPQDRRDRQAKRDLALSVLAWCALLSHGREVAAARLEQARRAGGGRSAAWREIVARLAGRDVPVPPLVAARWRGEAAPEATPETAPAAPAHEDDE